MNNKCELIFRDTGTEINVQINGELESILDGLTVLIAEMCETSKIPPDVLPPYLHGGLDILMKKEPATSEFENFIAKLFGGKQNG